LASGRLPASLLDLGILGSRIDEVVWDIGHWPKREQRQPQGRHSSAIRARMVKGFRSHRCVCFFPHLYWVDKIDEQLIARRPLATNRGEMGAMPRVCLG
jgi:hypothetical protein